MDIIMDAKVYILDGASGLKTMAGYPFSKSILESHIKHHSFDNVDKRKQVQMPDISRLLVKYIFQLITAACIGHSLCWWDHQPSGRHC